MPDTQRAPADDITLPALPSNGDERPEHEQFTGDEMIAYARAAVIADRASPSRADGWMPTGWRMERCPGGEIVINGPTGGVVVRADGKDLRVIPEQMLHALAMDLLATPASATVPAAVDVGAAQAETAQAAPAVVVGKSLNAKAADLLRPFLKDGDKVIWREAFRWKDDDGVLSNHYDSMELESLAADFGYEIDWDTNFKHAAIVRAATPGATHGN